MVEKTVSGRKLLHIKEKVLPEFTKANNDYFKVRVYGQFLFQIFSDEHVFLW